jgi:hypothetical protein
MYFHPGGAVGRGVQPVHHRYRKRGTHNRSLRTDHSHGDKIILVIEDLTVSKHCESTLIVILHILKEEVINRCRRANF